MRPPQPWDTLSYSTQKRLANRGDPRTPPDFTTKSPGRPVGFTQPTEVRRRISTSLRARQDPAYQAQQALKAALTLVRIYGTPAKAAQELKRLCSSYK